MLEGLVLIVAVLYLAKQIIIPLALAICPPIVPWSIKRMPYLPPSRQGSRLGSWADEVWY